ncbi:hypothetical protein WN51_14662 [Melipona quadrifasciata]|uniref:Uncharacterized protein n=1 Tax=Melipona quadrifasciata TaxID=166423 RepID=A0A0M8ZXL3_9HYME|nr:hypothetical protein WN51_14662 [Melipona quadrifasciata]
MTEQKSPIGFILTILGFAWVIFLILLKTEKILWAKHYSRRAWHVIPAQEVKRVATMVKDDVTAKSVLLSAYFFAFLSMHFGSFSINSVFNLHHWQLLLALTTVTRESSYHSSYHGKILRLYHVKHFGNFINTVARHD